MNKRMTSLALAVSLVAFAGCSKKKEEGTVQKPTEGSAAAMPPPKPEAPKPLVGAELAEKYKTCLGMISDGKLDEFQKDCIDPAYTMHDINNPNPQTATQAIGWLKAMRGGMPDMKLQPQLVMVNGRTILGVMLMTGTHTGPLMGPDGKEIPPTNKKVGMMMFHRLAISDANLATEEWAYMDPSVMMGQLGLMPKDAMPTRPAMDKGLDGAPIVAVAADDAKEKANLEAARKSVDAINAGKWADALALMTADAVETDTSGPLDHKGAKEMEASMKMWFGAWKDPKISIDNEYAAGDYVVHMGKFSGTNDKDMGKMKKTGKTVSLDYAEVMQMKDGKIAQIWRFHSGMQFAMQMGLMPAPAAAPAAGSAAPAAGSAAPAAGSAAPAAGSAAP